MEPGRCYNTLEEYLTGYVCKGGETSKSLEKKLKVITQRYCSADNNENKSLRLLMGKQMFEITNSMSLTQDQCHYMLSGGTLKRYTCQTAMKFLVTSMSLQEFSNTESQNDDEKKKTEQIHLGQYYLSIQQKGAEMEQSQYIQVLCACIEGGWEKDNTRIFWIL